MRRRYVWDPERKELVEVSNEFSSRSEADHHHFVRGDIPDFVSPVDGSVIGSRSELREHNKRHGVVSVSELCPKETARKAEERRQMNAGTHPSQKAARIEAIRNSFERIRDANRSQRRYG